MEKPNNNVCENCGGQTTINMEKADQPINVGTTQVLESVVCSACGHEQAFWAEPTPELAQICNDFIAEYYGCQLEFKYVGVWCGEFNQEQVLTYFEPAYKTICTNGFLWHFDSQGSLSVQTRESNWHALWPEQAETYIKARLAGADRVAIGQHVYVC